MRDPEHPRWPDRGERTQNRDTAEAWRGEYWNLVRDDVRRRERGLGPRPRSLSASIPEYLEHRAQTVERATVSCDRTATGHLLRHFGARYQTDQLTPEALQELVNDLLRHGYEPTTLETYIRGWRIFAEWCRFGLCGYALRSSQNARKLLSEFYDPTLGVTLPRRGQTDVQTLSDGEIVQLLEAAAEVDRQQRRGNFPSAVLACGVGLFMGLRRGEIFALSWQEIRPSSYTVRTQYQVPKDSLDLKPLKGKLARTALILPGWWDLHQPDRVGFVCGRQGRPVGTRTQTNLIRRTLDTASLNDIGLGWHLLRHTYARVFIESGGRLEELQKSLGHTSILTTERIYGHFHEDVAAKLAGSRIYGS